MAPMTAEQWMLIGADKALFTVLITIGNLSPAAMYSISNIKAKPFAEVAVIVLAPAEDEPTHALIALCSDSTRIISVSTSPSATN